MDDDDDDDEDTENILGSSSDSSNSYSERPKAHRLPIISRPKHNRLVKSQPNIKLFDRTKK